MSVSGEHISTYDQACQRSFKDVIDAGHCVLLDSKKTVSLAVNNEFNRYKAWTISAGASHIGDDYHRSLDYRLHETLNYKHHITQVLKRIDEILRVCHRCLTSGIPTPISNSLKSLSDDQVDRFAAEKDDSPLYSSSKSNGHKSSGEQYSSATSYISTPHSSHLHKNDALAPHSDKDDLESTIDKQIQSLRLAITSLYKMPTATAVPLSQQGLTKHESDESLVAHRTPDKDYLHNSFPHAESWLLLRLANALTLRRKKLKSYSKRGAILNTEARDSASLFDKIPDSDVSIKGTSSHLLSAATSPSSSLANVGVGISRSRNSTGKHRSFDFDLGHEKETTDIEEEFTSLSIGLSGDHLILPSRPKGKDGEILVDFECELCHLVVHLEATTSAWEKHVFYDLEPYQCTFRTCKEPEKTYGSIKEWLRHVDQHQAVFNCEDRDHSSFGNYAAFNSHMGDKHKMDTDSMTESQIAIYQVPVTRSSGLKCPLCLLPMENFAAHVALHLRKVALFALPPSDSIDEPPESSPSEPWNEVIKESILNGMCVRMVDNQDQSFITSEKLQDVWRNASSRHEEIGRALGISFDEEVFPPANVMKVVSIFIMISGFANWKFVGELLRRKFNDTGLPFKREDLEVRFAKLKNRYHIIHFVKEQYAFCPIIIEEGKDEPYEDKQLRLPFLEEENPNPGSYGTVTKVVIAKGYLMKRRRGDYAYSSGVRASEKDLPVARKKFRIATDGQVEKNVLDRLRRDPWKHEAIMSSFASVIQGTLLGGECEFNLFFKYAPCDLWKFLHDKDMPQHLGIDTKDITPQSLFTQCQFIADAISYLHREQLRMCHSDLKLNNILIIPSDRHPIGQWKITDFGIASIEPKARSEAQAMGDLTKFSVNVSIKSSGQVPKDDLRAPGAHQAPEVEFSGMIPLGTRYRAKGDIWSLGCIAIHILVYAIGGQQFLTEMEGMMHARHRKAHIGYFYEGGNGREIVLYDGLVKTMEILADEWDTFAQTCSNWKAWVRHSWDQLILPMMRVRAIDRIDAYSIVNVMGDHVRRQMPSENIWVLLDAMVFTISKGDPRLSGNSLAPSLSSNSTPVELPLRDIWGSLHYAPSAAAVGAPPIPPLSINRKWNTASRVSPVSYEKDSIRPPLLATTRFPRSYDNRLPPNHHTTLPNMVGHTIREEDNASRRVTPVSTLSQSPSLSSEPPFTPASSNMPQPPSRPMYEDVTKVVTDKCHAVQVSEDGTMLMLLTKAGPKYLRRDPSSLVPLNVDNQLRVGSSEAWDALYIAGQFILLQRQVGFSLRLQLHQLNTNIEDYLINWDKSIVNDLAKVSLVAVSSKGDIAFRSLSDVLSVYNRLGQKLFQWDLRKVKLPELKHERGHIEAMGFDPDGDYLVVTAWNCWYRWTLGSDTDTPSIIGKHSYTQPERGGSKCSVQVFSGGRYFLLHDQCQQTKAICVDTLGSRQIAHWDMEKNPRHQTIAVSRTCDWIAYFTEGSGIRRKDSLCFRQIRNAESTNNELPTLGPLYKHHLTKITASRTSTADVVVRIISSNSNAFAMVASISKYIEIIPLQTTVESDRRRRK